MRYKAREKKAGAATKKVQMEAVLVIMRARVEPRGVAVRETEKLRCIREEAKPYQVCPFFVVLDHRKVLLAWLSFHFEWSHFRISFTTQTYDLQITRSDALPLRATELGAEAIKLGSGDS